MHNEGRYLRQQHLGKGPAMAKPATVLTVFVASPGDVAAERQAVGQVVAELNTQWRRSKNIRLDVVRWETDTCPGFGEDPQAVVNEQIDDKYDIFVGILWKRFGTPTGRAGSGTEEEFNRAYERFKEDRRALRIMLYFRGGPLDDIEEINPEELARVRNFKNDVPKKGGLYAEYRSTEEFESKIRLHLALQVDAWGKEWGHAPEVGVAQPEVVEEPPDSFPAEVQPTSLEDEEGFLDVVEIAMESVQSAHQTLQKITVSMEVLGRSITERTAQMEATPAVGTALGVKAAKRVMARIADDLEEFARAMDSELPSFADTFASTIGAVAKAASFLPDFEAQGEDIVEPLGDTHEVLSELEAVMSECRPNLLSLRDMISESPRASTLYNRAKRRAVAVLDRFLAEVDSGVSQVQDARKVLEGLTPAAEDVPMNFDVLLCHNSRDKPTVRVLGQELKGRGLKVWLDEWELVPGQPWQEALEAIVQSTGAAAVLVGKDGVGPWQDREMRGCLSEFVNRDLPVIPIALPGASTKPALPMFLKQFTWVDLRDGISKEGVDRIVWGVTGVKPNP